MKPFLVELSDKSNESACLAIEQDFMAVYVDFAEGPDSLLRTLRHIGWAAALHCSGIGKCLLLNYSGKEIDRYIERKDLASLTENSISTKEQLVLGIEKVKSQGYAVDEEECEEGVDEAVVRSALRDEYLIESGAG